MSINKAITDTDSNSLSITDWKEIGTSLLRAAIRVTQRGSNSKSDSIVQKRNVPKKYKNKTAFNCIRSGFKFLVTDKLQMSNSLLKIVRKIAVLKEKKQK
jgi:ABC-type phosphate transport system substrate-binding protein